jgi:acetate kinase
MAVSFNKPETACILTINGGSSSIKFALYAVEPSLDCRLKGENAGAVRTRFCSGLAFLGMTLDEDLNGVNAPVISSRSSPVTVRVIRTNEEIMIAKAALAIIRKENQK